MRRLVFFQRRKEPRRRFPGALLIERTLASREFLVGRNVKARGILIAARRGVRAFPLLKRKRDTVRFPATRLHLSRAVDRSRGIAAVAAPPRIEKTETTRKSEALGPFARGGSTKARWGRRDVETSLSGAETTGPRTSRGPDSPILSSFSSPFSLLFPPMRGSHSARLETLLGSSLELIGAARVPLRRYISLRLLAVALFDERAHEAR